MLLQGCREMVCVLCLLQKCSNKATPLATTVKQCKKDGFCLHDSIKAKASCSSPSPTSLFSSNPPPIHCPQPMLIAHDTRNCQWTLPQVGVRPAPLTMMIPSMPLWPSPQPHNASSTHHGPNNHHSDLFGLQMATVSTTTTTATMTTDILVPRKNVPVSNSSKLTGQ